MFSYSLYVVCCLYVTFLLPPERAPKAGPCHLFTNVLGLHLSQYRASIDCFTMKSSKEKKDKKNWFADRCGGSPEKLLRVSVFDFSLAVISVMRMLLDMQGVHCPG